MHGWDAVDWTGPVPDEVLELVHAVYERRGAAAEPAATCRVRRPTGRRIEFADPGTSRAG